MASSTADIVATLRCLFRVFSCRTTRTWSSAS
ncbi:hypothetical protein ACFQV4_23510 [Streptomyces thermocarboxydus]